MNSHQGFEVIFGSLGMKVSSGLPCFGLGVDPLDEVIGDGQVLELGVRPPRGEQIKRESSLGRAKDDGQNEQDLHCFNFFSIFGKIMFS